MKVRLSIMGAAMALSACNGSDAPRAEGAWVRLPAVAGRPAAAYVTVHGGRSDTQLTGIRIPAARLVELHENTHGAGGMMSMKPVDAIDVPAGQTVALKPGGYHAMLFDLDSALKPGGTTRVTLTFDTAPSIELDAKLVAAGGTAPE